MSDSAAVLLFTPEPDPDERFLTVLLQLEGDGPGGGCLNS